MPNSSNKFDCAVIGNWHLAFVTAACLAKIGHSIALVDPFQNGGSDELPQPPVYEPGLPELLLEGKTAGLLHYFKGFESSWKAKYVWLAVDTPVDENDEVDLEPLFAILKKVADFRKTEAQTLIVSSQVPLGFCQKIQKEFGFQVAYIPENLRLGQGIETFLHADRTVIGAELPSLREEVRGFLGGIETELLLCDLPTAEMIKHATNAFLATSISFANEIARIGEKFGVDNQRVGEALRMDKRIGKKAYVLPGLGFAGGTLPRDLRVLQKLGESTGTPTPLADAVLKVNASTTAAVSETILNSVQGAIAGKSILILGYTYKAETNTLRRSLSVSIAQVLLNKGASVWGFDPFMNNANLSDFDPRFQHFQRWEDIPQCPHMVLLMTPRVEFKELNWEILKQKGGVSDPICLDVRGGLNPSQLLPQGFHYKSLWQPMMLSKTPSKLGVEL